jgi:hypothetical protein
MGASALLFGVLGWLTAHAATGWLAGHAGHGWGSDEAHSHTHLPAAALLVACLAGGSLLAIFVVAFGGEHRLDAVSRCSRIAAARRSSLLSTASFVAAEFVEHAATGQHDIPPAGVLLLGCAVHALMGAGSLLLWGRCVGDVLRLAGRLRAAAAVSAGHRILPVAVSRASARRTWRTLALAGRAPPFAACFS